MNWTNKAWDRVAPLYDKILSMPFNQELAEGTLPIEKFTFYIAQDAHYLMEFGRALAIIGGKMVKPEYMLAFSNFASGAVVVERALHSHYFNVFGVKESVHPSPACMLYTQFLLSKASLANVEESVAAVLPCFWVYKKVGDHIYSLQQPGSNNPYREWINTYSGEEFGESVRQALEICDALASTASVAQQNVMLDAFEMATRLEWMFWDSAYRLEGWRV